MIEALLKECLEKKGIVISKREAELFSAYYSLLQEWNEKMNLTSIKSEEDTVQKHFLDSLAPIWLHLLPSNGLVADIGAGAGFPSIPLCIVRPQLKYLLIESIGKKCLFLQTVIDALHLNAGVLRGRAEEFGKKELFGKCDRVVARAVGSLSSLISYSAPMLSINGRALFYKGPGSSEEMMGASLTAQKKGCMILAQHPCDIEGMLHYIVEIKKK